MKTCNNGTFVVFAGVLSILFPSFSRLQGQEKPSLEQRVEALELKVRMLESKIVYLTITGGKNRGPQQTSVMMRTEMSNIASMAWQYFRRPGNLNGGGGSYVGFSLAPKLARTDYGTYTVVPGDTEIVIEGHATLVVGMLRATAGTDGKLRNWTSTGDLDGLMTSGSSFVNQPVPYTDLFNSDMNNIARHAYQYRIRPRGSGGGGSYLGYVLPKDMSSTPNGWYAVTISDTTVVVEGRNKKTNLIQFVFVDSAGRTPRTSASFAGEMKKVVGGVRTTFDSLRETISRDFITIAARAYEYKVQASRAGAGAGTFAGYLSAQTGSLDGAARYECFTDPDAVLLKASLNRGTGSMSVKVDSYGRLSGWYYSGDLAR